MPVYKDEERKTWYCSFYYTDWQNQKRIKKKRGFSTQREAKEFEREFLKKYAGQPDMSFESLYELYSADLNERIRTGTKDTKNNMFEKHIIPYFKNLSINEITPGHIREWQNEMLRKTQNNGRAYSRTYLRSLNSQLTAIFNYAVKFQNLQKNPCNSVEPIGTKKADEMQFWTLEEFNRFISYEDKPAYKLAFSMLFWGGFRVGELLALTVNKIDRKNKSVYIDQTFTVRKGKEVFGPPKSKNSTRTVLLTDEVFEMLTDYVDTIYGLEPESRIFYFQRTAITKELDKISKKAMIKRIRVHDLRHSHVSLLIELGFGTHAIAKRIGDTPETVDKTYAHLYPHVQNSIVNSLNNMNNNSK